MFFNKYARKDPITATQKAVLWKDGGDFRLVFMEVRYQFVYGIELQVRAGTADKRQPHRLIVNISVKIEDMHLDAMVYAIIQRRAVTDT